MVMNKTKHQIDDRDIWCQEKKKEGDSPVLWIV